MSMAKKTKADKKTKSTVNKVSYHYRPDNMTLQDWQIALRRQAAMKEKFVISERDKKEYPGYYTVINPTSGNEYNVVYRGHQSPWNYCSCMDFKASQLGTCKHLEGVKLWIREKRRKVCRVKHGSPFYDEDEAECRKMHRKVYKSFPISRVYQAHIPTCPSGYWLFGFASKKYHPLNDLDAERWDALGMKTWYYTTNLHRGAFMLPKYVEDLLEEEETR